MNKKIQAKDISTQRFLEAVRAGGGYTNTSEIASRLGVPKKVVLAKTKKLERQGVVEGCSCGCSTNIRIRSLLEQVRTKVARRMGVDESLLCTAEWTAALAGAIIKGKEAQDERAADA